MMVERRTGMEELHHMIGKLESCLSNLDKKLTDHMDREEGKLDEYMSASKAYWEESVLELAELKGKIPEEHSKQHRALEQWIEEREWWSEIRKKTTLAILAAIGLYLVSRILPGAEAWFR
jgi:predicted  nucleic acid-binding Zn-ribbon protein